MALKISKLSRLFDFGEKKENILPEEQEIKEAEDSFLPPDPLCLQLPKEHALNQLWQMYSEQKYWQPVPELRLGGGETQDNLLPKERISLELERLLRMVTSTAEARLALVKPVPAPEEEEREGEEQEEEEQEEEEQEGEEPKEEEQEKKESDEEEKQEQEGAPDEMDDQEASETDLDAMAEVFLAEDEMAAWLLLYPPMGKGQEVDNKMLRDVLQEKKVVFGVEDEVLERLTKERDRYFHLFLIAQGKQPVDGKDGEIVDLYPRNWKPDVLIDDFGNVNYMELDFVQSVNEGDTICKIIAPVKGEPGMTVTNRKIPIKVGKKPPIPKGRNTKLSEDGSELIAAKAGHVEFRGQGFQVKPVLEISGNVDYSTGNIDFLGDVHISGNVCAGFSVRATGSITIDGVLEAGTVEAGGDLIVRKGIKGDQETIIRAGRSLYTKYLENATVCARERLESDCIINCNVYSNGDVQVCSGRGILIGGIVWASGEVRANIVGSRMEYRTIVRLGGLPSEEFELECLAQEIKELEIEYEKLERQPDSAVKARRLGMARMKLSVNRKKQEQFAKFLKQAEENLEKQKAMQNVEQKEEQEPEQEQDNRRLTCSIAYGGTEIQIGSSTLSLNDEVRPCTAVLIENKICFI